MKQVPVLNNVKNTKKMYTIFLRYRGFYGTGGFALRAIAHV